MYYRVRICKLYRYRMDEKIGRGQIYRDSDDKG